MNNLISGQLVNHQEMIYERLKHLENNQRILIENKRKLDEAKIYISISEDKKLNECTAVFFQNISFQEFGLFLTPFTKRYISACEIERDSFRVIFNKNFNALQIQEFANRISIYMLSKSEFKQRKCIDEFLNTITLDRLKAAVFSVPQETPAEDFLSDKNLLNRVQADSLIYPHLSNCKFSTGTSDTLRTIWKICIEDIDNFLEAVDTVSQTPLNANEAMQFVQLHQMQMALFAGLGGTGLLSGLGSNILTNTALMSIPFILNAVRKLYIHYLTKTPSSLPPLYVYSDPNFYQGVAPVKNDDDQKMLLRNRFDNSPKSVRYAIFATTTKGAEAFYEGDDGSLDRRFIRIIVPKFTSEETRYILHHQARALAPTLVIHPDVINRIVDHVDGEFAQSKKILFHALRKALKKNQTPPSQGNYKRKTDELNLSTTEHQINRLRGHYNPQLEAEIVKLNKEKKELEAHLQQEKLNIQKHDHLTAKRTQIMYKVLDISQEILELFNNFVISKGESLNQISSDREAAYFENADFKNQIDKLTKELIYYNYFLNPTLCKKIKDFEEAHGLISEITNDFITDDDLRIA